MDIADIIQKALMNYDSSQPLINFLQKFKYKIKRTDNDFKRTVMFFEDTESDKVILKTEIETLAIFYDKYKIWSWAWSQPDLLNSENFLAKQILMYSLNLESDMAYIKSILSTSRGIIKDPTQTDINLAISSSIIKKPYIYPFVHKINDTFIIYYLILINNDEIEKIRKEYNI